MAVSRPVLPDKDELLAACRGFPDLRDDPVLTAAAELAVLHQTREQMPHSALATMDGYRERCIRAVDNWALLVLPEPEPDARVHTHTIGQVIDNLARLTAHTYTALAQGSDEMFWAAADIVDDHAEAYTDLVAELLAGTRRLPLILTAP
ncbi:hypothetical protein [Nocardia takedensis]|uniref:hypothetical protein n=1 Tax=Nocardia takedensis TaxID=259390 RepID=UPI000314F460|nr:hypothetical protein [Nocardia takedensis]